MKENAYKGYETFYNGLRMSTKMHANIFVALLFIQATITIIAVYIFYGSHIGALARYARDTIKYSHSLPDMTIIGPHVEYLGIRALIIFAVAAVVYAAYPLLLKAFKSRASEQSRPKYLRGAGLTDNQTLQNIVGEGDLPIGGLRLPRNNENTHVLVAGRTGSGKTVCLSKIVSRIETRQEKAIIYDFKGDYTERFYETGRDVLFNPLDSRSMGWCPFADIETKLDINNIAASLIPPARSSDSFWHDGARAVLTGLLHYLWQNDMKTNADIWQAVTAPAQDIHGWLQGIPEGQNGFRYIEDHSSKQALGILSTMMQYASAFEYTAAASNNFSINEWLRNDKPGFIFVTNQSDTQDTLRPILSLFIDYLSKKLLSMPEDIQRRRFFILDEFGTLQRLSSIKELLIASRSKGGSCWLGIQDIAQLQEIYGKMAATIINACGSSVMFGVSDPETARYLINKIGDTEFIEPEETLSMGVSDYKDGVSVSARRRRESLLLDSQLLHLPELKAYVQLPASEFLSLTDFQYEEYPKKATPFIHRRDLVMNNVIIRQEQIKQDAEALKDPFRKTEIAIDRD